MVTQEELNETKDHFEKLIEKKDKEYIKREEALKLWVSDFQYS